MGAPSPDARADRREGTGLAMCLLFFIGVQLAAVDFGDRHWDEPSNVKHVVWGLTHHVPFPQYYLYPGAMMMALVVAATPEILADGVDQTPRTLMEKPYRLRARALLIVLSGLSVVAAWALSRGLGRGRLEALCAAALVATSWQLGFHARFITPDALVASATTAALALLTFSLTHNSARLLMATAACAGLATGVKYTPGVLLLVVWVAVPMVVPAGDRLRRAVVATALFCGAFFVTTPGALFEPFWLLRGLQFQREVYGQGWQGYTVAGPLEGARALLGWLLWSARPALSVVSVLLALLSLAGMALWLRDRRGRLLLLFVALFLGLLLPQHVFMSRNVLALVPLLAVAAATTLGRLAQLPRAREVTVIGAALLVLSGALFCTHAARTVRAADDNDALLQAHGWLSDHRDTPVLASKRVRDALPGPFSLRERPDPDTRYLLAWPGELFVEHEWPSNNPLLVREVFGPLEIDWRYAPTWRGSRRLLLLDLDRARAAGAALDFQPVKHREPDTFPMELIAR